MQDHPKRVERMEAAIDAHLAELYAEVPEATDLSRALLRAAFGVGYDVCLKERPHGRFAREHGSKKPKAKREPVAIEPVAPLPESWDCWACGQMISRNAMSCETCGSPNLAPPRGMKCFVAVSRRWEAFIDVYEFAHSLGMSEADASEYATEVTGQAGPEAVVV